MTQVKFSHKPFQTTFNTLVDDLFAEVPVLFNNNVGEWKGSAPVNIKESEKSYSIDVIAPGFDKTDFKINLEQNILTITAEKNNEVVNDQPKDAKEIRKEYSFRSFKRSFTLEEKIDSDGIEAKYVNGILTLNLPKKEVVKSTSKDISIQ
jgi:HSP20 family protein